MLTRMEIDGFKSFRDLVVDFDALSVVVGPNAVGKSNLFDAIRLMSLLAQGDLRQAVKGIRGEPQELFRRGRAGEAGDSIRLAAEVLLEPKASDPWGTDVDLTHTRIRYEVVVARRRDANGFERLSLIKEEAKPIAEGDDAALLQRLRASRAFQSRFLKYGRFGSPFLETSEESGRPVVLVRQDDHQGRKRFVDTSEATVLSSVTSAEFPHLYALRAEIASWRFLQLDPTTMRRPSSTLAPDRLAPDGSNLPTVLAGLENETRTQTRPHGILPDLAAELARMIPGLRRIEVVPDKERGEYRMQFTMGDGPSFSSRVVSDGMLRLLALLTLLHDPHRRGLICMEEPENGLHPGRLVTLIESLKNLVVDPSAEEFDPDETLSQLLFNSHSPVLIGRLHQRHLLFADMISNGDPVTGETTRRTRFRPVATSDQMTLEGFEASFVTSSDVVRFLSTLKAGV